MSEQDEHWKKLAVGSKSLINTPQQLMTAARDYFDWCDSYPIKSKRTLTSGKEAGKQVEIEHSRPYSIKGFCIHTGISERWIMDIKESQRLDSEYYETMEQILYIIYTQNLEGAYVDIYNPIMVSKVLALDKVENTTDKPPRVEIIDDGKKQLANSESEVLEKLDYGKVEVVKSKAENPKEQSAHVHGENHVTDLEDVTDENDKPPNI